MFKDNLDENMLHEINNYAQTKQTKERGTVEFISIVGLHRVMLIIRISLTHLGLVTLYCVLGITKLLKNYNIVYDWKMY